MPTVIITAESGSFSSFAEISSTGGAAPSQVRPNIFAINGQAPVNGEGDSYGTASVTLNVHYQDLIITGTDFQNVSHFEIEYFSTVNNIGGRSLPWIWGTGFFDQGKVVVPDARPSGSSYKFEVEHLDDEHIRIPGRAFQSMSFGFGRSPTAAPSASALFFFVSSSQVYDNPAFYNAAWDLTNDAINAYAEDYWWRIRLWYENGTRLVDSPDLFFVRIISLDPVSPLYAFGDTPFYFKSLDNGLEWSQGELEVFNWGGGEGRYVKMFDSVCGSASLSNTVVVVGSREPTSYNYFSGAIYYSGNSGTTWSTVPAPVPPPVLMDPGGSPYYDNVHSFLQSVCYNGSVFVAGGGVADRGPATGQALIISSPDGLNWTRHALAGTGLSGTAGCSTAFMSYIRNIVWNPVLSQFVAIGETDWSGTEAGILSASTYSVMSPNGVDWTVNNVTPGGLLYYPTTQFTNGLPPSWCYVGPAKLTEFGLGALAVRPSTGLMVYMPEPGNPAYTHYTYTSTDGINWSYHSQSVDFKGAECMTYYPPGDVFVVPPQWDGVMYISSDGITWTSLDVGNRDEFNSSVYNPSLRKIQALSWRSSILYNSGTLDFPQPRFMGNYETLLSLSIAPQLASL